jgi:DNA-binding response OmpR family regulator
MSPPLKAGFRIGDWAVHPQENRLCSADRDCDLEPRVMDVLVYLAERQGQVVSRQEVLDSVWARLLLHRRRRAPGHGQPRSGRACRKFNFPYALT